MNFSRYLRRMLICAKMTPDLMEGADFLAILQLSTDTETERSSQFKQPYRVIEMLDSSAE
jgi:hypothetical protein